MSPILNKDQLTPKSRASIVSLILFTWMNKLLYTGWKRPLIDDDIYQSPRYDSSSVLGQRLSANWEKHIEACAKKNKRPSFKVAVYKTFYKPFIFYGIFSLVEECVIRLIQVLALDALIDYFNEDLAKLNSYLVAQTAVTGIIMSSVMFMLSFHWSEYGCHHTCTQIRVAISSMIYQKTLSLSQNTLKYFSVGQLITMMSSDVHRFDQERIQINYIWIAPLHLIAVVYLLLFYFDVGWPSIAGLGVLLIYIFCQCIINHYLSKARLNKLIASNSRMKIILEIMQVFHSIKIYALENSFYRLARESRLKELAFLKTTMIIRLLNTSISLILTKMSIFVTLLFLVTEKKHRPISSSKVFITILLYEHVRINFATMFVEGWRDLVEISVTLKRLTDFFLLEEVYESEDYKSLPAPNEKAIEEQKASCGFNIQGLKCKWNQKQQYYTLKNINMSMKSGDFHAIIGQRDSGKSSLMAAILGEIPISDGSIVVQGRIAYVPQTPWLFQGTIRDNILFGLPYEEEWYREVIEVSTISTDIDRMREGDDAEVFVSVLSTDQKARIALARAIYSKADIYLLDEPFSSIDIKISKQILENCIKGVLKNKAVLLVSHQIHLLEAAGKVVILEDGECIAEGLYSDLVEQGIEFVEELGAETEDVFNEDDPDNFSLTNTQAEGSGGNLSIGPSSRVSSKEQEIQKRSGTSLTKKELQASIYEFHRNRSSHAIEPPLNNRGIRLYWLYLKSSASMFLLVILFILSVLLQVLYSGSDYWLEAWIHFEEKMQRNSHPKGVKYRYGFEETSVFYIIVFSAVIPALIVVTIIRSLIVFKLCINASLSLFCQLTDSLLKAKPSFIAISGVGHGINKFSKDIIIVDELLPATLYELTGVFFEFIGAIGILGYCDPYFLIPSFIFVLLSILAYKIYHSTASALKRIESNARSPVYGHIANSLEGMSTIRAYGQEDMFMDIFYEYMDTHTNSWSLYIASYSWLSVVVDWLSILLISSICIIFIYQDKSSSVLVGLAISKAVELSILAQNGAVATGDMESEMISVERILEFAATPPEGILITPKSLNLPREWPKEGRIEFRNVSCDQHLLKNLNFVIEPGQKVGIVGRSGSGKSSLFNALFRIFNVKSGKILIDGISIKDVGLHDLRKRLGALPQRPHVFTGTIRSNLDPFDEFEDREIWNVLEEVGLFGTVKSMDEGLSSHMCPETGWLLSESGTHLLSLARVLLKKQKILIWEEATSFIDPETQTFLLKKLNEHFHDSTVVTIAHKVQTVIEYDVIIVIEAGRVIDIGEPHLLIKNQGPFFQLIDNFGSSVKDEIIKAAKDAYLNKHAGERKKGGLLKATSATIINLNRTASVLRSLKKMSIIPEVPEKKD